MAHGFQYTHIDRQEINTDVNMGLCTEYLSISMYLYLYQIPIYVYTCISGSV